MIVDQLENLKKYSSIHPLFPEAINFLQTHHLNELPIGKTELKGQELVVNVAHTEPKGEESARLETHHDFIDIQLPLSGTEIIGYTPAKACLPTDSPYNKEKDITFFEGAAQTYITLQPGMFAIFFPEDGHAPGITPCGVKKIVVKIKA